MSQLKTVILAGGKGSRLEEITKVIPKPLVKLRRYPIIIPSRKLLNSQEQRKSTLKII